MVTSSSESSIPRCIVVTGVARVHGIGAAIAVALLEAGYAVCGLDHSQLEGPTGASGHQRYSRHPLRQLGPASERFMLIHDWKSGDQKSSENAVEKVLAFSRGHLVGLVNCGGFTQPYMPAVEDGISPRWDHFQKVIAVNLCGPFLLTELIAPHMMNGSGSVVNLSSTRAYQSEPNCEAYDSSKAGLIGLTHAQAISLGPRGIRVNCVLPGWVESSAEYELTEGELKFFPIGRAGVSRDIAELCLFLLDGRKSGFITGQEFVIDGGVGKKMIYL